MVGIFLMKIPSPECDGEGDVWEVAKIGVGRDGIVWWDQSCRFEVAGSIWSVGNMFVAYALREKIKVRRIGVSAC